MEDDVDYMSDKFVVESDIRPGLVHQHSAKRKIELEKKQVEANKKNYRKPIRILEAEQRTQGLSSSIPENNIGFALLQKMGYKPGTGIGKKQETSIREPVPVILKTGRSGLGKDSEDKEKAEIKKARIAKLRQQRERARQETAEEYRERMRNKAMEKQIKSDVAKAQRVCEKLDSEHGLEKPVNPWFWPDVPLEENDEINDGDDDDDDGEEEEEELESSEKLALLTSYLRETYLYCIWCGTHFEDEEDMEANCPGNSSDLH